MWNTLMTSPKAILKSNTFPRKYDPGARVLCVEGDSAFGFSGMEFETMARSSSSWLLSSPSLLASWFFIFVLKNTLSLHLYLYDKLFNQICLFVYLRCWLLSFIHLACQVPVADSDRDLQQLRHLLRFWQRGKMSPWVDQICNFRRS